LWHLHHQPLALSRFHVKRLTGAEAWASVWSLHEFSHALSAANNEDELCSVSFLDLTASPLSCGADFSSCGDGIGTSSLRCRFSSALI
jgi:hypothetical protein